MNATIEDKDAIRQRLNQRAAELVPVLRARAAETAEIGRLPEATIADFQEAGFFRILQPAKWGGYELKPHDFFDIQIKLAEGCMSSAWVLGVVAIHNWQLGLYDDRAAQDVWGEDTSVLISSSYMPVGKVERVEGGLKLSGRWGFSSGSKHCDWVFLGAMVPPLEAGGPPDYRTFLVPRSDYDIVDNWAVTGLQGTGSHDIVVKDAFVPEYRTHKSIDGFNQQSPGNEVNTHPVFKLPFGQIFVRAVSSSAIGALQGAINDFIELAGTRVGVNDGRKSIEDPGTLKTLADAIATVDECKAVLYKNFDIMYERAVAGEPLTIEERVKWRYDSARVAGRCNEAANKMFMYCGSRAIFANYPLNRVQADIQAGLTHVANVADKYAYNLSGVLLGKDSTDFFL
ncbi:flavin-dependent monooxygenase [Ferrimonas pelagia]|uniref:Flavin-dependent monooxygenase n=1 Tax=Ferrimonas pelagia TaxID=1177826 RepID=A0ABP9ENH5_9GAMM